MATIHFITHIVHWRYETGWRQIPYVLQRDGIEQEYNEDMHGWHCWAYPGNELRKNAAENKDFFIEWMKENMTGYYEAEYRFNSVDPMYTIFIKEEEDATLFRLRWR